MLLRSPCMPAAWRPVTSIRVPNRLPAPHPHRLRMLPDPRQYDAHTYRRPPLAGHHLCRVGHHRRLLWVGATRLAMHALRSGVGCTTCKCRAAMQRCSPAAFVSNQPVSLNAEHGAEYAERTFVRPAPLQGHQQHGGVPGHAHAAGHCGGATSLQHPVENGFWRAPGDPCVLSRQGLHSCAGAKRVFPAIVRNFCLRLARSQACGPTWPRSSCPTAAPSP